MVKGKSGKLAKNGKVVDLRDVADQQAKNYINALQALVSGAPDSADAEVITKLIEEISGYHGFE